MPQRVFPDDRRLNSIKKQTVDPLFSSSNMHLASPNLSHSTIQRAHAEPSALAPAEILQLQRTVGNQVVQRLVAGVQPRHLPPGPPRLTGVSLGSGVIQTSLQVGPADDKYEQEAEQVARKVTNAPHEQGTIQRTPESRVDPVGEVADSKMETEIRNPKGSGQPVPEPIRNKVELATGADLRAARVYDDKSAHALNDHLQADAFTHGNRIFLGRGQSVHDTQLMAHELTHTAQQTQSTTTNSNNGPAPRNVIQRKTKNLKIDKRLRQKYSGSRVNGWLSELRQMMEEYNAIPRNDPNYYDQLQRLRAVQLKAGNIKNEINFDFLSKKKSLRSLGGPFRRAYYLLERNLTKVAEPSGWNNDNAPKWSIVQPEFLRVKEQALEAQGAHREAQEAHRQELTLDYSKFDEQGQYVEDPSELTLDISELNLNNHNLDEHDEDG